MNKTLAECDRKPPNPHSHSTAGALTLQTTTDDSSKLIGPTLAAITPLGFTDCTLFVVPYEPAMSPPQCLSTSSSELYQHYAREVFANDDMLLQHARSSSIPVFMSRVEQYLSLSPLEIPLLQRNQSLFRLFRCAGFSDLYCVPVTSTSGNDRYAVLFATQYESQENFKKSVVKHRKLLHSLAEHLCDSAQITHRSNTPKRGKAHESVTLTSRPRQLLEIMAKHNLTLKESALSMGISLDTANKHVASIKQALNARTTASAVYKGLLAGIIEYSPE